MTNHHLEIELLPLDYSLDVDLKDDENTLDIGFDTTFKSVNIIPNPPDEPTDQLVSVKIDTTTFDIYDDEVHDWARSENKPDYTPEEIGAINADNELTFAQIDALFDAVFN